VSATSEISTIDLTCKTRCASTRKMLEEDWQTDDDSSSDTEEMSEISAINLAVEVAKIPAIDLVNLASEILSIYLEGSSVEIPVVDLTNEAAEIPVVTLSDDDGDRDSGRVPRGCSEMVRVVDLSTEEDRGVLSMTKDEALNLAMRSLGTTVIEIPVGDGTFFTVTVYPATRACVSADLRAAKCFTSHTTLSSSANDSEKIL
jgi:hypothetical protein